MMFRALSVFTLATASLAFSTFPRSLVESRDLVLRHDSDCPTCLNASTALQNCTTASACCSSNVITEVVQCADCIVIEGTAPKSTAQSLLGQFMAACAQLGVDTGSLTVDTSSGAASATPSVNASTASGASTITATAPVFTGATALSSLASSASAAFTSFSAASAASASQSGAEASSAVSSIVSSASAVAASATSSLASAASAASASASASSSSSSGSSGAAGLTAPASLLVTGAVGVAALFLA
ncbi:unnamed protein product [Peniophora sp. CBMAI 1063]|nr:unnamed protein product [Peniophora sp. CBMAI 1063]